MAANIPNKFKISGREYAVLKTRNARTSKHGQISYALRTILINVKGSDREITDTFWHEATHAILHDMQHPQRDDEKFVRGFAKRMTDIIMTAQL